MKVCGVKNVFFEFLHAKPCRIIWKFPQKLSVGPETCEFLTKVAIWGIGRSAGRTGGWAEIGEPKIKDT